MRKVKPRRAEEYRVRRTVEESGVTRPPVSVLFLRIRFILLEGAENITYSLPASSGGAALTARRAAHRRDAETAEGAQSN
jgi:hypothetical protein